MKLSEFKRQLALVSEFAIQLPTGEFVPNHFHITEMGIINKKYTDCGNTFREENYFTFQLWYSQDTWHRLTSEKVLKIIAGIEKNTNVDDFDILVEYQDENTIGKFGLEFTGEHFRLTSTKTTCLAQDNCGIPTEKIKKNIQELASCCTPNSGCC
ncbi:hypothetical protein EQG63_07820 [Flavobacterium amnicola]|uniref:Uncharacterized protein n=1 Tax=Flavobacterium amnicola TaxID=2506422 RepID=A0A4Q1K3H7_9FLAO|nr:DUF6428 family protein [Flavobacterium amnicola]RXR19339.1 hypothetical protein EQG63_07820 [Flavobacterium amnicola]